VRPPCKRET